MRIATINGEAVSRADHSAASTDLKPKTLGSKRLPRSANSADRAMKLLGGITPRFFQLQIAESPTPTSAATAAFPPRASTMASTDLSIPLDSSPGVNMSSLHRWCVDSSHNVSIIKEMIDSSENIGRRLGLFIDTMKVHHGLNAARIADRMNCTPGQLAMYRKGFSIENGKRKDRPLTIVYACRLVHAFPEITLDWLYMNDRKRLDAALRFQMDEIDERGAA